MEHGFCSELCYYFRLVTFKRMFALRVASMWYFTTFLWYFSCQCGFYFANVVCGILCGFFGRNVVFVVFLLVLQKRKIYGHLVYSKVFWY